MSIKGEIIKFEEISEEENYEGYKIVIRNCGTLIFRIWSSIGGSEKISHRYYYFGENDIVGKNIVNYDINNLNRNEDIKQMMDDFNINPNNCLSLTLYFGDTESLNIVNSYLIMFVINEHNGYYAHAANILFNREIIHSTYI